ncbi:TolB family protein [Microtetraspora malaysiensis]|uniref:TolB family protein n=1 Tax=Microtetraspora malaysiensis TaxID=161358 RepID=UPI003D8A17A8
MKRTALPPAADAIAGRAATILATPALKLRVLSGLALVPALLTPVLLTPDAALARTATADGAGAAATAVGTTSAAPKPLEGVAVYFKEGKGNPISRYDPSNGFTKIGSATDAWQFSASPDGTRLAWITLDGKLHVGDGSTSKIVAKGAVAGGPCTTPVWSPDSTQVAYFPKSYADNAPLMVVNADGTGARKVGKTFGVCHLAWSADGRHLAGYTGTTDGVYVFDMKTGTSVRAKGIKLANHVQSLSPDGRKVVVHTLSPEAPGGDGGWPVGFRPTIVDTVTGKKVPIPVKGTKVSAFYLADGRLVVRVLGRTHNTLVVLDSAGRELQRLAEPAQTRNQGLLQIVR